MNELEPPSALEKAISLRKQAEGLLRDAKEQAVERAQKAIADLKLLGFSYKLIEEEKAQSQQRSRHHYRVVDVNKSQACASLDTAMTLAKALTREQPGREFIVEKVERVWPHA